jgi:hypothetical protein
MRRSRLLGAALLVAIVAPSGGAQAITVEAEVHAPSEVDKR